ncbi:hypothetical protein KIPB_008016, partial [Kipferlia bialata]
HPLSLVEIPGVYNPFTKRGAEDVETSERPYVCNHTHAATLLGNCVYYICRVDIRESQSDGNYEVHGMRVFECPLDTMEWREIGEGSREKGEWFPEGYTENVCVVGDTIVCEMTDNCKLSLWAFDPQHSDGSDIRFRRWTSAYPAVMTDHQRNTYSRDTPITHSGNVQMGRHVFRLRLTGNYIAHLMARDPITQREEIWAEIDRKLTCPYVTHKPGTERNDWHKYYHDSEGLPILTAHTPESLYCIIAEGSRGCEDRGYVIRLSERALQEVYGHP